MDTNLRIKDIEEYKQMYNSVYKISEELIS